MMVATDSARVGAGRPASTDPRPWRLLSPALMAIALLVVAPMTYMLVYSFYENVALAVDRPAFQFGNWSEVATDGYYHHALLKTFRMALIVTVISIFVAYPAAYFVAFSSFRQKWLLLLLLLLPFWVSFIIRTLSWIHIMGNQGAINAALLALGVIDEPIRMMFNEFAVIVGFVHVFLPFMILNIYVSLDGIDRNLAPAARSLGATPLQTFREVTLPLSLPGLAAGSLLVFILTGGSYITPLILGGPDDFLFSNLIYDAILSELNWPMGATLSFTLLACLGSVVLLYSRYVGMSRLARAFG